MKQETYPDIDMKKTGELIRKKICAAGLTVKYIQEKLYLSCPQPVYRWFKGQILPSVNHLYVLSRLLGVHMEELLVQKADVQMEELQVQKKDSNVIAIRSLTGQKRRLFAYWNALQQTA